MRLPVVAAVEATAVGLRTVLALRTGLVVAALCAILLLSWGHRPRGCPPSKTGFRLRSRHPRRHPSSTGRALAGAACSRALARCVFGDYRLLSSMEPE